MAGIGVWTNHRLPIFHFLLYRTGICWIGKARLLRLFSTLQNANLPKNKKLASDDSQQDGSFSLLFGGKTAVLLQIVASNFIFWPICVLKGGK